MSINSEARRRKYGVAMVMVVLVRDSGRVVKGVLVVILVVVRL